MQREFKNTVVSPLSMADAYNKFTHKNLSSPMHVSSPTKPCPTGEKSEKGQAYRNNSLEFSIICHMMLSSEWGHVCLFTW